MSRFNADAAGNTLARVGVPVTGKAAIAPFGTTIPTPEQGKAPALELDQAFKTLGLRTTDGAPEYTLEADGDPIEFYEDGYQIPSGKGKATVVMKLAETSDLVRELIAGKKPDANGYIEYDAAGHATRYVLYTENVYKNGVVERRIAPNVQITSVKEDKPERGSVRGYEVTFTLATSQAVGGKHFGEWLIQPAE